MSKTFYEFPHSHFCEKARWAIDWKGIPYQRRSLLPPLHVLTTRRYGSRTSVPLFLDEGKAVQGSSEIMSYLDHAYPERPLFSGNLDLALKKEKSIDKSLGVPLRVFFYQYGIQHKDFVSNAFTQNSGALGKAFFRVAYPFVGQLIRRSYGINEESAQLARSQVLQSLDQLWGEKQAPYFSGEGFGRIDMTIASLLAPIVRPPEHPMHWETPPEEPELQSFEAETKAHPLVQWVSDCYRDYRMPAK